MDMDTLLDSFRLSFLPDYLGVILLSFSFWTVLQYAVAPPICNVVLGKEKWGSMDKRIKNRWLTHIISFVHALIVVPFAASYHDIPVLDADRVFAWDARPAKLYAIATGYFLWDSMDSVVHYEDIGFTLHALACFWIYGLTFRPFLQYYASRFLLWETSTLFLNVHWFIDKTGRSGSRLQLINGFLLLASFAGVRLVYGGIMSYQFFYTMLAARNQMSPVLFWTFSVANIMLQGLNWFWFTKMITALKKRFVGPPPRGKRDQSTVRVVMNGKKMAINESGLNGVAVIKGGAKQRSDNPSSF